MKKILTTITVIIFGLSHAQVGIEVTDADRMGDELLYFQSNANGGIVLPRTDASYNGSTKGGELRFDTATNTVQYYTTEDNSWKPLTKAKLTPPPSYTLPEKTGKGVIITTESNTDNLPKDGVLTLISDSHALTLPRVQNVETLPNPQPGTICYDENSSSLAVFNGDEWSFWN